MAEFDELDEYIRQIKGPAPAEPQVPQPQAAPSAADFSELDATIAQAQREIKGEAAAPAPAPEAPAAPAAPMGLGERFVAGATKAAYDIWDAPAIDEAQALSAAGYQAEADAKMAEIMATKKARGLVESDLTLKNVLTENPDQIAAYAAQTLGELAPYAIAFTPIGRAGAGLAMGARAAIPALARWAPQTVAKFGAGAAIGAGGVVAETAGIGEELYQATGTTQGAAAIAAGVPAGLLESAGGLSTLGTRLLTRGAAREVGEEVSESFGKQLLKTTGQEARQEASQEALAIAAREYADPNYGLWSSDTFWRLGEAATAGAVGGAAFGGAGHALEKALQSRSPVNDLNSASQTIPELQAPLVKEADKTLRNVMHPVDPGREDALDLSGHLKQLNDEMGVGATELREVMEANTDRYLLVGPNGVATPRLYTDTELEQRLATDPQSRKYRVIRADQSKLNPRMMSADEFDLPPVEDNKVWFLPEVSQAERPALLEQYRAIQQESARIVAEGGLLLDVDTEAAHRARIGAALEPLHAQGLRVIPSYGHGFQYRGGVSGPEVVPGVGKRSRQIGVFNPDTGQIGLVGGGLLQSEVVEPGIPVALDLNKFRPGEVSGVPAMKAPGDRWEGPLRGEGWRFAPGTSEAKKAELFSWLNRNAPGRPNSHQMQYLMSQGMWYEPSKTVGVLVPKEGTDLRKFTYGVRRDRVVVKGDGERLAYQESGKPIEGAFARLKKEKSSVERGIANEVFPPEQMDMVKDLEREARKYTRKLDRLMRKFGMPGGVKIIITNVYSTSTTPEHGEIYLSPEQFLRDADMGVTTGDFVLDVNTAILHEAGHIVTLHLWAKLPVPVRQMLKNAYNRALLADRLRAGDIVQSRVLSEYAAESTVVPEAREHFTRYYQTFAEWLAEQIRRYARSDAKLRSDFEFALPEVAAAVKRFYNEWEAKHDRVGVLNLRHPDNFVGAFLDQWITNQEKMAPLRRRAQQQEIYRLADGIQWSPDTQEVMQLVIAGVNSVKKMNIVDVPVVLSDQFDPRMGSAVPGQISRYTPEPKTMPGLPYWEKSANPAALIELAVGSLKPKDAFRESRVEISKQWTQAYLELGLFSEAEVRLLADAAKEAGLKIDSATQGIINFRAQDYAIQEGLTEEEEFDYAQQLTDELLVIELVSEYARTGVAPTQVQRILQILIETFRRIRDMLGGAGYHTREQLLRAIFNGDIAARYKAPQVGPVPMPQAGGVLHGPMNARPSVATSVIKVDNELNALAEEYGGRGANAKSIIYYFFEGAVPRAGIPAEHRNYVGYIELKNQNKLGFEVDMVEVTEDYRGRGYAPRIHKFWTEQLGMEHKPSGILTPDGYNYWKRKKPEAVKYHQLANDSGVPGMEVWVSPRKIDQWIVITEMGLRRNPNADAKAKTELERKLRYYKKLRAKVNPKAWGDPTLKRAFARPEAAANGIQASVARNGLEADTQGMVDALDGMEGQTTDSFSDNLQQELKWTQAENAKALGIPYGEAAPQNPASRPIRQMAAKGGFPPAARKKLERLAAQQDQIGHFSKHWWGLLQLGLRNEHITGLQTYIQHAQQMAQRVTSWMSRADVTAGRWEKLPDKRRQAVGDTLFWLAEMRYRTPEEVRLGVVRHPTPEERMQVYRRFKLRRAEVELIQGRFDQNGVLVENGIEQDFWDFLKEVERVGIQNINNAGLSAPILQLRLDDFAQKMAEARAKPYFPFLNFGKYILIGKDPEGKTKWFSTYETEGQRRKAEKQIAAQHKELTFTWDQMPEEAAQYLNLPPTLLQQIKENIPGDLTPAQIEYLDQMSVAHLSANTFRRTWLSKPGVPGFSLDAFRAYAHYFRNGSKFLARLEFDPILRKDIAAVEKTAPGQAKKNVGKRRMIVDYMRKHHRYITTDARDFSSFKAFTALYMLGFSPVAAGMNLLQTPAVLSPYLRQQFGVFGTRTLESTLKMMRRGATTKGLGPRGEAARLEMIAQGRIQIGQAAELAAFAEGPNLKRLGAGTQEQRLWRNISYYGMYMFSKTEQLNREIAFRAAWDLAHKYPNTARLQEVSLIYPHEIAELTSKPIKLESGQEVTLTHNEAVAVLFAREAIDMTQGNYSPVARPAFLQNPVAGASLIFFQYMQTMISALMLSGAAVQMLFVWLMLYGLQGFFPGIEDLNALLQLVAGRLGYDFNLMEKVREFVVDMTEGTDFDTVAPGLLMHGISKFGFGLSLWHEYTGMPWFDVSGNGSMGQVIPSFSKLMQLYRLESGGSDYEKASASILEAMGGAGASPIFALLKVLAEPNSTAKMWEGVMPRFMRDISKSVRYGREGETTKQGAPVVTFDVRDPEDLATVVGQALGIRPGEVTTYWESLRAFADSAEYYKARYLSLYAQYDEALRSEDPKAVDDVLAKVNRYNDDVAAKGLEGLTITKQKLSASAKGRERTRQKQEMGVPLRKGETELYEQKKRLYPELIEQKQVR